MSDSNSDIKGGFLSSLLMAYGMIPTMKDYSKASKKILNKYGNLHVLNITVYREPIQEFINKVLNIATLGSWQRAVKKYGYDRLFHLYIIVIVMDPKTNKQIAIRIEKNEIINVELADLNKLSNNKQIQSMNINRTVDLYFNTINMMLQKTKAKMGDDRFWSYNAFTNNCQTFIKYLLDSNDLLTPELLDFIDQNAEQIAKSVSKPVKYGVNTVTKLASKIRRIQNLI